MSEPRSIFYVTVNEVGLAEACQTIRNTLEQVAACNSLDIVTIPLVGHANVIEVTLLGSHSTTWHDARLARQASQAYLQEQTGWMSGLEPPPRPTSTPHSSAPNAGKRRPSQKTSKRATKPPAHSPPVQAVEVEFDAQLLMLLAEGVHELGELAAELGRPHDEVTAQLDILAGEGLVVCKQGTVFSLTDTGTERASRSRSRGGQEAVLEQFFAQPDTALTVQQLAMLTGCSPTMMKKTLRRLAAGGLVRPLPRRGGKGVPHVLTDMAAAQGRPFAQGSPRMRVGWGEPTRLRQAVLQQLVQYGEGWLRPSTICREIGWAMRDVNGVLTIGVSSNYVERQIAEGPRFAYEYRLTQTGVQATTAYLKLCDEQLPPLVLLPADAYLVRFEHTPTADDLALLIELAKRHGVSVQVLPD